jgi:hypothetical protein
MSGRTSRDEAMRLWHHRYKRIDRVHVTVAVNGVPILCEPCMYCGMPSQAIDHVPALARVASLFDDGLGPDELKLVPSCGQCNAWLGHKPLDDIKSRAKYVRDRIADLLRPLRTLDWQDDEVAELGHNLRSMVRASMVKVSVLKYRLDWASLAATGVDARVIAADRQAGVYA